MKSNPTSVPIYRPQSDSSKRQQPQKKLTPIKVSLPAKSPNHKKAKDQEKNQSETEENVPHRKAEDPYTKMKSRQATESSASKKKIDVESVPKQSRIKPKKEIISHTKISAEHKDEIKTAANKEIPIRRNMNPDAKSEKTRFNIKVAPKTKETEEKKTKPQVKSPKKTEIESKIPVKVKGKNNNYNSPSLLAKREKAKINEKPIKKELPKQNNSELSKKQKNTDPLIKPKKPAGQKDESIRNKIKNIKEEEEDAASEEEIDFDIYKKYQKETILSKYLKNQGLDESDGSQNKIEENKPEQLNKSNSQKNNISNNNSSILSKLSDLSGDNQIQCLDDIIEEVQNWSSDFLSLKINVYLELTEKLSDFIKAKKYSSDDALFKAAAIITKIAPLSDVELLKTSLPILTRMSSNGDNSALFVECHLVDPLLKISFNDKEIDDMSKNAAKTLCNIISNKQIMYEMLQLDTMAMICKEISLHARRGKFNIEYTYYLNDVLSILVILSEKTSDFSKYLKYSLPINLLGILKLYRNDNLVQNKVSEIFKIILDFDENVEQLECEDLSPLFALLESSNQSTVENAIFAISNAISISDFFVDNIAELEPPLGIVGLCNKLQKGFTPINSEILKSLVKLTSFQQGAMMAVQSFNKIASFMDFDPYELMGMQNGQADVMCAMKILKNLAYIIPDRVAAAVDGKLKFFCQIGAVSVVVELAKIIIKTSNGRKALEEVRDIPQVASLF